MTVLWSHSETTFFKKNGLDTRLSVAKVLFLREAFLSSAFVDTVSDQKLDSSEGLERDYFLC